MRKVSVSAIAVAVAMVGSGSASAQELDARPIRSNEISTVSYTVSNAGEIRVYLPTDIRAGDTISGTVVAVPAGKNDAQKATNASVLNGYVVSAGGGRAKPNERLTFAVSGIAAGTILTLIDKDGKSVGAKPLPTNPTPAPRPPSNFELPEIVQPGDPCAIQGPFDGDASDTKLTVGGKSAPTITESPRMAVAMCPSNVELGPTTIEVEDNGMSAQRECHSASVKLSAQRTMQLGQSVPIEIQVMGLQGFSKPIMLRLHNHTPGIVELRGDAGQDLGIVPTLNLSPFGLSEAVRSIGGLSLLATSVGEFEIRCELLAGGRCGATTHELFISGPSKRNDGKGYHVEWKEVCYLGTCYLKRDHAGDHAYSWAKCKTDGEKPHKETFKTSEARDARYREIEKDRDKRKAAHDFGG